MKEAIPYIEEAVTAIKGDTSAAANKVRVKLEAALRIIAEALPAEAAPKS